MEGWWGWRAPSQWEQDANCISVKGRFSHFLFTHIMATVSLVDPFKVSSKKTLDTLHWEGTEKTLSSHMRGGGSFVIQKFLLPPSLHFSLPKVYNGPIIFHSPRFLIL